MRRPHHLAGGQLAPRDTVIFTDLHHVGNTFRREIVDWDAGNGIDVLETEVNVGRGQAIHMEPDVSWPPVFDEVLILVLVSTDVAYDVFW
mmetsp:Transcript_13139/g.23834  ORF Transcript_13139/g.23834 Transcript_13139/m.23834 type:complete len:90 (+) Transcript_13139:1278-1547(+)